MPQDQSSTEVSNTIDPQFVVQAIDSLYNCRHDAKQIADLNGKPLGLLVQAVNTPLGVQLLSDKGFTQYNNEMHGIFIQSASKEFKKSHGFDEDNFPFADRGGPQRGKIKFGYIYKYYVGKADTSDKLRKYYIEDGVAIIVVFRDNKNKKRRTKST